MKTILIKRIYRDDRGTIGKVLIEGETFYTIEKPWIGNTQRISCIPTGTYMCKPRMYYRGGYPSYEITNVANRKYILFHVANYPRDVLGCIGLGTNFQISNNQIMVSQSRVAFNKFMNLMDGIPEFTLVLE